jgi:flagellar biosynthetic protein FliQ
VQSEATVGIEDAIALGQEALRLAVVVSLPVVVALAVVGLCVSLLQAAMQLQDQSVGQLARLLTALGVLLAAGSWMGTQVVDFARKVFGGA